MDRLDRDVLLVWGADLVDTWLWFPIGAVLSGAVLAAGKAATRWFVNALRRSLVDAVTEIVTPLVAELREWVETVFVRRLDDHEDRITALEDPDG